MTNPYILLFGSGGQLGREILSMPLLGDRKINGYTRQEIDICDRLAVRRVMDDCQPRVIVNAAAYSAVDLAEENQENCYKSNAIGPGILASEAASRHLPIIHISTDFVFDGFSDRPYREDDQTNPLSVYGSSKLVGEQEVAAANPCHVILRTAWLYSKHGRCFPKTIYRLLRKQGIVSVVDDQKGNPTTSYDLGMAIINIASRLSWQEYPDDLYGMFHFCGSSTVSRFEFAQAIAKEATRQGLAVGEVVPCATVLLERIAKRPANSSLDCTKINKIFRIPPSPWQESLPEYIKYYGEEI